MKIGIIVAMAKELELLKPHLQNMRVEVNHDTTFYCGSMGKHDIVAMQCGIGKVNAAVGTVTMIDNFSPQLVINTGVAGGASQRVNVMDLVVGAQVCYHDVWCGFDGVTPHGQVQGLPLYFEGADIVIDNIDERPGLHCGLIVSGDQFIDSIEQVDAIKRNFPAALAVDMESGAIAQTCYLRKTPFVSMRIISDSPGAGHDNTTQYNDFWTDAPQHTLAVVRDLLQKLD
ncbi:MAG: 5'-methylthioadenosine/adenosylhomocysteine nucleosidase [Bacteroidales bacterium]|nr:5'-methylthioadenosine/adenosylhomocysteine nucleosidase [Bacteroidales bacterium]